MGAVTFPVPRRPTPVRSGRGSLFPLVVGDWPLIRAVCVHHEKLRIGLWTPVIERSLVAKAQARATEHDVLGVGRPRTVTVVSGCVRQKLEVGAVRPDSEDVK